MIPTYFGTNTDLTGGEESGATVYVSSAPFVTIVSTTEDATQAIADSGTTVSNNTVTGSVSSIEWYILPSTSDIKNDPFVIPKWWKWYHWYQQKNKKFLFYVPKVVDCKTGKVYKIRSRLRKRHVKPFRWSD